MLWLYKCRNQRDIILFFLIPFLMRSHCLDHTKLELNKESNDYNNRATKLLECGKSPCIFE